MLNHNKQCSNHGRKEAENGRDPQDDSLIEERLRATARDPECSERDKRRNRDKRERVEGMALSIPTWIMRDPPVDMWARGLR
jgi:hypothetical protein